MAIVCVSLSRFAELLKDSNCDAIQYDLFSCKSTFCRLRLGFRSSGCFFKPIYQTYPIRDFTNLIRLQHLAEQSGKFLLPQFLPEPKL